MDTELSKLLRLIRRLIIGGLGAVVAFWVLAYTWLAFNH